VAAYLTLDPATTDETLATIFGAQRPDPERTPAQRQTQRDAGAALIAALRPRDPVEAAYAARAAAAHYGSMDCFRRAMLPDTPDSVGLRWHGKAVALSRMNIEMVRELRQGQAEAPRVQPQPATRPAMPAPAASGEVARQAAGLAAGPVGRQDSMSSERRSFVPAASAITTQPTAALVAKPAGRQACPRALDPRDPMPSERPSFTPAASAIVTQPAAALVAKSVGRQDPMSSERPSFAPAASAIVTQPAAALVAKPVGRQDPLSSERPSFTPAASAITTQPTATSFLSAPPPRQSLRSELLGSTAGVAAMLAAITVQARPHAQ